MHLRLFYLLIFSGFNYIFICGLRFYFMLSWTFKFYIFCEIRYKILNIIFKSFVCTKLISKVKRQTHWNIKQRGYCAIIIMDYSKLSAYINKFKPQSKVKYSRKVNIFIPANSILLGKWFKYLYFINWTESCSYFLNKNSFHDI